VRALAVALAAFALAPAAWAAPIVTIPGATGPGPATYNRVFVEKWGPANAKRVLVLTAGLGGGAGDFGLIGPELVARVPDLQVWAVDRREQAFEDTSVFDSGNPAAAADYYLSGKPIDGRTFKPVDGAAVPFVRRWGLPLALEDLRRVVLAAREGGRRSVLLGGHSYGASTAVAYATWDFAGRPGYRGLAGLVLIDGGELGAFPGLSLAVAKARLAALAAGSPFLDELGIGLPWLYGVFAQTLGLYALTDPGGPAALQSSVLLPAALRPPVPVTNAALLGFTAGGAAQFTMGGLAPAGDPRPWQDGGLTPIARLAQFLAASPANANDWYYPQRLAIDIAGADRLTRNPVTTLLGLRTWHLSEVNVPVYAFETNLTHGGVLRGARALIAASKIPAGRSVLAADHAAAHDDPLVAPYPVNRFLQTVVLFLRGVR
jgi:hypothetical protein